MEMDDVTFYKNFNMVLELDIAGEFIYDGMTILDQINYTREDASIFSFFYHISVGIERLQKIIIVLSEKLNRDTYEQFENRLKTHIHVDLHNRIKKTHKIDFNSKQNNFLQIITKFYSKYRYNHYHLGADLQDARKLFINFIQKNVKENEIGYNLNNDIIVSNYIKEMLGRTIGSIVDRYYKLIVEESRNNCLYSYEIRQDSKAAKVFYNNYKKKSLFEQKINEQISLKEFIVYLMNTKDKDPLIRELRSLEPLSLDPAFINEFIGLISKGIIPQDLVDQVEQIYIDGHLFKERGLINVVGDNNICFEYAIFQECIELNNKLLNKKIDDNVFIKQFDELSDYLIYYADIYEDVELEKLVNECKLTNELFENGDIDKTIFLDDLIKLNNYLKVSIG